MCLHIFIFTNNWISGSFGFWDPDKWFNTCSKFPKPTRPLLAVAGPSVCSLRCRKDLLTAGSWLVRLASVVASYLGAIHLTRGVSNSLFAWLPGRKDANAKAALCSVCYLKWHIPNYFSLLLYLVLHPSNITGHIRTCSDLAQCTLRLVL